MVLPDGPGQSQSDGMCFQDPLSDRVALQLDRNKYKQSPFQFTWILRTAQTSSLNLLMFDNGVLLGTALLDGLCSPTVTLQYPSIFLQPTKLEN